MEKPKHLNAIDTVDDPAMTGASPQPASPSQSVPDRALTRMFRLLVLGGLVGLIVVNLTLLFHELKPEAAFMLQHPGLTASQKLKLPNSEAHAYELAELIIHSTPPTSTILIPVASDVEFGAGWPGLANGALLRGFLYPRQLIAVSNAEWEANWQRTTQPDVYILILSYEGFGGQVRTWPAKRPAEQSIIYVGSDKWGFAPVSQQDFRP